MSTKCPFATLLRQAGVNAHVVRNLRAALIADQAPGGHPEDVAAALLKHFGRKQQEAVAKAEFATRGRSVVALKELLENQPGHVESDQQLFEWMEHQCRPSVDEPDPAPWTDKPETGG